MVGAHSSNFRVITTNFLGVRIFRKFTVLQDESEEYNPVGPTAQVAKGAPVAEWLRTLIFRALNRSIISPLGV